MAKAFKKFGPEPQGPQEGDKRTFGGQEQVFTRGNWSVAPAPTPAPTPRAIRYPSGGGAPTAPLSEINQARARLFGTPEERERLTTERRTQIRTDVRAQFQDYIDAINVSFNRLLEEEKGLGLERAGRTRATASARGTLGGSFGEADIRRTGLFNIGQQRGIEEDRRLALAEVFTKIDERSTSEIEARRLEREGKAEKYLEYLEGRKVDTEADIKQLAATGISKFEIPEDRYKQLLEHSELDPLQFDAIWNESLPAHLRPTITDTTVRLDNGNAGLLRIETDPQTGESTQKRMDFGVTHEELFGKYPGGTKEVGGILYGIKADGTLIPLTKKEKTLKDFPASYQEWSLAGKPGTYEEFLRRKQGEGKFSPTADERSAVARYLSDRSRFPNMTPEAMKEVMGDQETFYGVLEEATQEEGFNLQPFKYPFAF